MGEATSFLDHVYLGCTQRECQLSKDIVDNYPGFLLKLLKKQQETNVSGKLDANIISSWSYDVEGRAKKCVEGYCELANKTTQQLHKVATPRIDDHQFKEEDIISVGDLSAFCSEIVVTRIWKT